MVERLTTKPGVAGSRPTRGAYLKKIAENWNSKQISPRFGIFSVFRFPFPFSVPVPVQCSRSRSAFLFPFPFRDPVPKRRCANGPMRSCAHADEPMSRSAIEPMGSCARWDSKRGPNLNFYAIWNFPKRGEIWTKIEFLRDMDKLQCPGFEPASGPVPCFYHLAPWPLDQVCQIFIFFITFDCRVFFQWFFLPIDGEFKAEHICLLCQITIRQFYPLHSLFGDFDPLKFLGG